MAISMANFWNYKGMPKSFYGKISSGFDRIFNTHTQMAKI